ncbi:MAG: transcriptional regulator [Deltaproteobacteria bacterium]|nr:transcriptional regulator [Deltaproteobacteria bacterium]
MRSADYFEAHPVFRHADFLAAHTAGGRSAFTSNNLLARHLAAGRLVRVRRGLYAVVPRGVAPDQATVDPYLVSSHLTDDAGVAYHAALQFFGKTYSVWRRFHYLTCKRARPFSFRGMEFVPVMVPANLRSLPARGVGVIETDHVGGRVRVTTLERTLVDVLDKPDKCGGWEEIWRSLEMVEFFDLDAVISYAMALGSALTVARVGFFLDQHREALMVEDSHLELLRAHVPDQPRYLDGTREPGRLVTRWNLVVPDYVLHRRWEEAG